MIFKITLSLRVAIAMLVLAFLSMENAFAAVQDKGLILKNGSGDAVACIDALGNLLIKGDLSQHVTINSGDTANSWVTRSSGTIVAHVVQASVGSVDQGDVQLSGELITNAEIAPDASHVYILNSSTLGIVAAINDEGDLQLRGFAYTNLSDPLTYDPLPDAPSGLVAVARSERRIDLSWSDNTSHESGYRVYRSTNGISYTLIASLAPQADHHFDKQLTPNTTYYYRVNAYNLVGESSASSSVQIYTPNDAWFNESWDSVDTPIYPAEDYDSSTTGTVSNADNLWFWQTQTGAVTATGFTDQVGFRTDNVDKQLGRFDEGGSTGSLLLETSITSFSFETREELTAGFEASFEGSGNAAEPFFGLELRSETDFSAGIGTMIRVELDASATSPAMRISSANLGSASVDYETTQTLADLGGQGRYWVRTTFSSNVDNLGINYAIYNLTDSGIDVATPVLTGSAILIQRPTITLDLIRLSLNQYSVGSLDDIHLASPAPAPEEPGGPEDPEVAPPASRPGLSNQSGYQPDLKRHNVGSNEVIRLDGVAPNGLAGFSVASIGDFNGDGFDDIVIGAPWAKYSPSGASNDWDLFSGEIYLVQGPITADSTIITLKPQERALPLPYPHFATGISVAGAGDVNNDGYADMLIGAPWGLCANQAWDTGNSAGEVYLIYGKPNFNGVIESGNSDQQVIFEGINPNDNTGQCVAGAGDFDADGYSDLLIGAPGANVGSLTQAGTAYLVSGRRLRESRSFLVKLDQPPLDNLVYRFSGGSINAAAGSSVAGANDINGDGYSDILIGAPTAEGSLLRHAGRTYVVYGGTFSGLGNSSLSLDQSSSRIDTIHGLGEKDEFGSSVAFAGDVNGDGYADALVGAPNSDTVDDQAGRAYLILGGSGGPSVDLEDAIAYHGDIAEARGGASVSGAGDLNGDGMGDFLIGAPGLNDAAGGAYGYFGNSALQAGENATYGGGLDGGADFGYTGLSEADNMGMSVATAGDVIRRDPTGLIDGLPDLIVTSPKADVAPSNQNEGNVFFFLGSAASVPTSSKYSLFSRVGQAPLQPVGHVGAEIPTSRCWIGFSDGYANGNIPSYEEITLVRSNTGISNLSLANMTAAVRWHIQTDRIGWHQMNLHFHYLNAEVEGLSLPHLKLFAAPSLNGPWEVVPRELDHATNTVRAQVTKSTLEYFVLSTAAFAGQAAAAPQGITLNWDELGNQGVTSYEIYRSTSPDSGFSLLGAASGNGFFDDTALDGVRYYYYIVGVTLGDPVISMIFNQVRGDDCLQPWPSTWFE